MFANLKRKLQTASPQMKEFLRLRAQDHLNALKLLSKQQGKMPQEPSSQPSNKDARS